MPSPIALTSPPRQESIFKKRSPSYLTAMRSAQSYLMALSEADARSRGRDSASTTDTPALSMSSSATTLSEDDGINDAPYDNSDGLAYPMSPPTSEQLAANHLQFGFCPNENYRYRSAHKPGTQVKHGCEQDPPYYILITTYLSFLIIICIGHIRDFFGKRLYPAFYRHLLSSDVSFLSCFVPGRGSFRLIHFS
jgi:serine palmitoyltransferase